MSKSKNRPDVDTLLAERARFEAWLDQLLAKASKVPAHVVERVRGDYEARLSKVVEELRSRADDLRAETASLETRLATLEQELSALQDARAEDELRAMVGEYDDAAWQLKSAEHDDGIRRVEADRDRGQADLTRVREMLAETTRPSRAIHVVDEATIPDEPTPVEAAAPVGDGAPAAGIDLSSVVPDEVIVSAPPQVEADLPRVVPPPVVPEVPPARNPSPFDEIGFLRTVVGRATPYAGVETPVKRASVAQSAPVLTSTPRDVAAVPAAAVPVATPPEPVAPPAPPPAPIAPPAPPPTAVAPARVSLQVMPSFDEPMLSEPVAPVVDADAEARASEASRTLKCQECGWMNYPTEWYCEKCGGELAAF